MKTKFDEYLIRKDVSNENEAYQFNQWIFNFPNRYGASVVSHKMNGKICTYGNEENPYELAVLHKGELCYDTEVADDVKGYLNEKEVEEYLEMIFNLRSKENE